MPSVENVECGKCGVWKMRSVESEECGKCGVWKMRRKFQFSNFFFQSNENLTSEQHSVNCNCITSLFLLRVSCD